MDTKIYKSESKSFRLNIAVQNLRHEQTFYAHFVFSSEPCKCKTTMHFHVIYEVIHSELMKRQLCLMQMMHSSL